MKPAPRIRFTTRDLLFLTALVAVYSLLLAKTSGAQFGRIAAMAPAQAFGAYVALRLARRWSRSRFGEARASLIPPRPWKALLALAAALGLVLFAVGQWAPSFLHIVDGMIAQYAIWSAAILCGTIALSPTGIMVYGFVFVPWGQLSVDYDAQLGRLTIGSPTDRTKRRQVLTVPSEMRRDVEAVLRESGAWGPRGNEAAARDKELAPG